MQSGTGRTKLTLLVTCGLQTFVVFLQGVFAGSFLSGVDHSVSLHEGFGWVAFALALIQILLVLLPSGRIYGLWFAASSIAVATAEVLQLGTGYGRFLRVHVPLAIVIVGMLVWQLIWIGDGKQATAE